MHPEIEKLKTQMTHLQTKTVERLFENSDDVMTTTHTTPIGNIRLIKSSTVDGAETSSLFVVYPYGHFKRYDIK